MWLFVTHSKECSLVPEMHGSIVLLFPRPYTKLKFCHTVGLVAMALDTSASQPRVGGISYNM